MHGSRTETQEKERKKQRNKKTGNRRKFVIKIAFLLFCAECSSNKAKESIFSFRREAEEEDKEQEEEKPTVFRR